VSPSEYKQTISLFTRLFGSLFGWLASNARNSGGGGKSNVGQPTVTKTRE